MTVGALYVAGPTITFIMSFAVLLYLRRPLRGLLVDLCGTETRAGFWTAFSVVTLLLTPEIFALASWPDEGVAENPIVILSRQVKWALIGLVASVIILGLVLGSFIPRTRPAVPVAPVS